MAEPAWLNYLDLPEEPFSYGTRIGLTDDMDPENLRVSLIRFDPGNRGPLHYHKAPIEECYLMLDGQLDITVEGEVIEAAEGDFVFLPPETEHFPHNTSDEPARFFVINAPNLSPGEDSAVVEQDQNTVVVEEAD